MALDLPVLELVLLFDEVSLELLKLGVILLDRLSLLVDLLLQRLRDLVHVLVVLVDLLTGLVHIFLQVFKAERTLVQTDIQRRDITKEQQRRTSIS